MRLETMILSLLALALASPAQAHDFWAGTAGPGQDGKLTVYVGFGHNFPVGEEIAAETAGRYAAPRLMGPKGTVDLVAGASPTSLSTGQALAAGTYLAATESKEGFSGRSPSGWVAKSKREDPTVTRCSYGASFGKAVVNVGGASDAQEAAKPVGHKLEIVPGVNPAAAKAGAAFPIKVLFEGKPLPRAQVQAFFAGFTPDNSAYAFSATTDKDGALDVIPLRGGQWLILASHSVPYADQTECDTERWGASLSIAIAE